MEIIKETDSYVEYRTNAPSAWASGVTREQKFMCFGGPFDGQKMSSQQLLEKAARALWHRPVEGYSRFNSAGGLNGLGSVWVWISADRIPKPKSRKER